MLPCEVFDTTANRAQNDKTSNKTIVVSPHSSLVVFGINRLSFLSRRQDTIICCPQETYFTHMDMHILQIKGYKQILYAKRVQNPSSNGDMFI